MWDLRISYFYCEFQGSLPFKSSPFSVDAEAGLLCTARVKANKGRAIKAGTGGKCRTIWSRSQEVAVAESGAAKVMSRGQG